MRTKKTVIVISLLLSALLFLLPVWLKGGEVEPGFADAGKVLTEGQDPGDKQAGVRETETLKGGQASEDPKSSGSKEENTVPGTGEKSVSGETPALDTPAKKKQVQFIISKNYGQEILFNKQVVYQEKMTVMDGLLQVGADVETSYEGSFISSINNLRSQAGSIGKDWFFYVNGIFADTGALDYFLQPGEKVWWDYHPWKTSQGTQAVIGSFPEPFLHGFRGRVKSTTIFSLSPEGTSWAAKLQKALTGYGVSIIIEEGAGVPEKRKGPAIVVGEWKDLKKITWLKDFNEAYRKNGTFVRFTDSGIEMLDYKGEVAKKIDGGAGVLYASGQGSGDASPLWVVAGTDRKGTEDALDILISCPEKIKAACSAVVLQGEVIKLPVMR